MINGYFVTGTDTGVGKTFVSTLLARRAVALGHKVFAFKPIETGCEPPMGDDQRLLVDAAGAWQTDELRGLYQFRLPAAPIVAALAEHATIDLARIDGVFGDGSGQATFVLVEGAGGWRVPITEETDMSRLAARIGLPVLLVARATLGTINHTLLAAEAIQRDGQNLAGVILSHRPDDDPTLIASNLEQLSRHLSSVVVLGRDETVLDRFIPSRST